MSEANNLNPIFRTNLCRKAAKVLHIKEDML
jgi:hypothetical protein